MRTYRKKASFVAVSASRAIRCQPNYHSEISDEYLDGLQNQVNSGKPEGFKLTPISEPGW